MNLHNRPLVEQMAVAYATEIERLQAECAKLRAALEKLLKDHEDFFGKESISEWKGVIAARNALANEEPELKDRRGLSFD